MLRRSLFKLQASSTAATIARGASRASLSTQFAVGEVYNGFEFVMKKDIPDLNLSGYQFIHAKTKTPYFHLDTDDINNSFCIGFCTPAPNDKGTTHVLEHTVLCGSEKYPVRDPFFMMLRRSLSTFMNAMTGADYTLYPFSTTNPTDYKNLLSVYLDAVLKPLLRVEDFNQEGHRIEVPEKNATAEGEGQEGTAPSGDKKAVQYNGVVYNEMRGVMSEPGRHFVQELQREVLPNTHYAHLAGGYPPAILDLTHEELVDFHKMFYHPSNAMVITYGDMNPTEHMKAINEYFDGFEDKSAEKMVAGKLNGADRRGSHRLTESTGPLDLMGDPTKQMRVAKSYAVPDALDTPENINRLSVLSELLTSGPSSPMYKALIEPQLGSKYAPMTGYASWYSTPMLSFGVEGVSQETPELAEENRKKIEKSIDETITEVIEKGFDQRRVDSTVFQEELQQRHRSTSYGTNITTTLIAFGLVRPTLPVLDFLDWLPKLKEIAKDANGILCPLLKEITTPETNGHSSTLVVKADEKHLDKLRVELEARETKLNEKLSKEDVQNVEDETAKWLERVRAPQNADVLPTLTVSDIAKNGIKEPEPLRVTDTLNLIPASTNGLVYVNAIIPMFAPYLDALGQAVRNGPEGEMKKRVMSTPLMYSLLGNTGTSHKDFKDFSIAEDLCCSGFNFSQHFGNVQMDRKSFIAGTTFGFYTTKDKLAEAFGLLSTVFLAPRLGTNMTGRPGQGTPQDIAAVRDRIKSLTKARISRKVQGISHSGHTYALMRASAATGCPSRILRELLGGITQIDECMKMMEIFQDLQKKEEQEKLIDTIVTDYAMFAESLTARAAAQTNFFITCEQKDLHEVETAANDFTKHLQQTVGDGTVRRAQQMLGPLRTNLNANVITDTTASPVPLQNNTTIDLPLDTSFVGYAVPNDLSFCDKEQQVLRVASQIIKNEFLHRAVREEGGAYGAQCASNLQGDAGGVTMSSYRDPTPQKTVETFNKVSEWIGTKDNVTQERVDQSKLRLFATIDAPMSPDQYGSDKFLFGAEYDQLQVQRQKLLDVSVEDVLDIAPKFFSNAGDKACIASLVPQKE